MEHAATFFLEWSDPPVWFDVDYDLAWIKSRIDHRSNYSDTRNTVKQDQVDFPNFSLRQIIKKYRNAVTQSNLCQALRRCLLPLL